MAARSVPPAIRAPPSQSHSISGRTITPTTAVARGVRGPPESFLIDPDGFVVSKIVGEVTAGGLETLIERVKQGPS
jgi:hypothetical protein